MERPEIVLSILICHIFNRKDQLAKLLVRLAAMANGKPVEVLHLGDNGEMAIGAKRNELLFMARGKYVSFVDDDDDVSDDYVEAILKAVEGDPDCVGIEGMLCTPQGNMLFKHSIEFQGWYTGGDAFYRTPNHLNPVRRSMALEVLFPEIGNGEDRVYSDALRRRLKTETYIEHPIYFYKKDYSKP